MVILIVVCAIAVMALAAIAGTGRFGEWLEPVNDRPKGRFPDLPFGPEFLYELQIPKAVNGYDRGEVDTLLHAIAHGALLADAPRFRIRLNGYDMAFVDTVLDHAALTGANPRTDSSACDESDRMDRSTTKE